MSKEGFCRILVNMNDGGTFRGTRAVSTTGQGMTNYLWIPSVDQSLERVRISGLLE